MSDALTLLELAQAKPSAAEPAWLTARRDAARDVLAAQGLPTKRTEAFRFTSVKALVESRFLVGDARAAKVPSAVDTRVPASPARVVLVDGQPVLDGFAGSGTTLLAAERTGRISYGLEIEPRYVDVAIRRMAEHAGLEAVHAENGRTFEELAAERAAVSETAG